MSAAEDPQGNDPWASVAFFRDLDPALRETVVRRLPRRRVPRGGLLIAAGTPADALFFVVSGRFAVTLPGDAEPFSRIGAGHPIGEIGFFAGIERTADVTAVRDSVVLELTRELFEELAGQIPAVQPALIATLSRRLAETTRRVSREARLPPIRTVAIVPATAPAEASAFVSRLVRVLARDRRPFYADADLVRTRHGATSGNAVSDWLNGAEMNHDIGLYVTDRDPTDWSLLALRQADIALVLLDPAAPAAPTPIEGLAFEIHPEGQRWLAVLHPRRRQFASGTARLIAPRPNFQHHHIALADDMDIGRLARFLTGRATGFVAGGGGALGAAHIGLYKACREAGLLIDHYGGTSAGSAMAGAFASGHDADDIDRETGAMFVAGRVLRRPTIPRYSLLDHRPFDEALRNKFTEVAIEDLWLPYFAVATSLGNNRPEVIRHGPLWQAIRASGAIPGILPPFFTADGDMLVDGGLTDNIPVDIMRGRKRGPNLVACCSSERESRFAVDYSALPGRGELARRMLNPFGGPLPPAPGVADIIIRSLLANQSLERLVLEPEDWLLRPPMPVGIGFMNWEGHAEISAAAYAYMRDEIAKGNARLDAFLPDAGPASGARE